MKTTRLILVATLFLTAGAFTYAGPGAWHFTQRRAKNTQPATTAPVTTPEAACPHCKITTVERPVASGKVTIRTEKMACTGCAKMDRGEKC